MQFCVKMILGWVWLKGLASHWLWPKNCPICIPQGQAVQNYLYSLHQRPLKPQRTCCGGFCTHHMYRRGAARQRCLIMLTPHQRMHLQSTGVFVFSLRGTFLYPEESFWGPASVLRLIKSHFPWSLKDRSFCGSDSDVNSFHFFLNWSFKKL